MNRALEQCREIVLGLHSLHRRRVEGAEITAEMLRSEAELLTNIATALTELAREEKCVCYKTASGDWEICSIHKKKEKSA